MVTENKSNGDPSTQLDYDIIKDITFTDESLIPTSGDYFLFNAGHTIELVRHGAEDLVNASRIKVLYPGDKEENTRVFSRPSVKQLLEASKDAQVLHTVLDKMTLQLRTLRLISHIQGLETAFRNNLPDKVTKKVGDIHSSLNFSLSQLKGVENFLTGLTTMELPPEILGTLEEMKTVYDLLQDAVKEVKQLQSSENVNEEVIENLIRIVGLINQAGGFS